jgi:hypothetical protein
MELIIIHLKNLNNWHLYSSIKELFLQGVLKKNNNLYSQSYKSLGLGFLGFRVIHIWITIHSLVSQKEVVTKGVIIKGGFLYGISRYPLYQPPVQNVK